MQANYNSFIMSIPLVDIHTHQACAKDTICIRNCFPDDVSRMGMETYFSVGLHPWYIGSEENMKKELLNIEEAATKENCHAIGEAGLDKMAETKWELQEKAFQQQISLAENISKPVIIHCVKAYGEILKIRKDNHARGTWIFHGFNSSPEMADQLLEHGCMVSFGKFLFNSDAKALKAFMQLEQDHFFLETDDEELSIAQVYEKAAELKGMRVDELKEDMIKNYRRVFGSKRTGAARS